MTKGFLKLFKFHELRFHLAESSMWFITTWSSSNVAFNRIKLREENVYSWENKAFYIIILKKMCYGRIIIERYMRNKFYK